MTKKNKPSKNKSNQILHYRGPDHKIEELKNKIKDLSQEITHKDNLIKKFQEQLSSSNELVLKLTRQVDMDLHKLYSLHENLIPTHFPSIPNCAFSFKFISSPKGTGKDFYQVIPLKKMHFGVIISSCASHILSALLFSSRLKLIPKYKNAQPADVLQTLAKEVHDQHRHASIKIDIFYSVMNRRTYKLSYCSIGQIYGFLYCFSTKKIQELKSSSPYFNINNLHDFSNQKISFNPRDRLILCSPGIVEALNKKGQKFGVERLKQTIQNVTTPGPHQLRNEIIYSVQSFTKDHKIGRDQSIVVMEIKDRILKLA